jgi:hypothetical protein
MRTPPGVPRRHSCRRWLFFNSRGMHRDESRRGTQECVRHIATWICDDNSEDVPAPCVSDRQVSFMFALKS